MMTEKDNLLYSRRDLYVLFVKKTIIVLLAITPIVAYFIWVFPWQPSIYDRFNVHYLDHYRNQTAEDKTSLLDQWVDHYIVTEVKQDLFKRLVFDKVLILITHNEGTDQLYVDYLGQDHGSDIISHYRSSFGFSWKRLGYNSYDWTIYRDSNMLTVFYSPDWLGATLYLVLAIAMGGVIYSVGNKPIKDDLRLIKAEKEKEE